MDRIVELRMRLQRQGLVLLENDDFFVVTNNGPAKRGLYHEFKSLEDVECWLKMLEGGQ